MFEIFRSESARFEDATDDPLAAVNVGSSVAVGYHDKPAKKAVPSIGMAVGFHKKERSRGAKGVSGAGRTTGSRGRQYHTQGPRVTRVIRLQIRIIHANPTFSSNAEIT